MNAAPLLRLAEAAPVRKPTLFIPDCGATDPEAFDTVEALAHRIRAMARGQAVSFVMGRCAYPGFADFASVTARIAGVVVGVVGGPWASGDAGHQSARDVLTGLAS